MKFRLQKLNRLKEDVGRDRISELSDDVIIHILSFLPTLDAVKTVLLRRFGNLWTLVPTLRFDIYEFQDKMYPDAKWEDYDFGRFYIFIRSVLMLHQSPSVQIFSLCLAFRSEDEMFKVADDIKLWLNFALDKQAKEIIVRHISQGSVDLNPIPANFTSQSLVILELSCCSIEPQIQVDLGSLKKLLLDHVSLTEKAFQQFIFGCPSMQELSIIEPNGMKKVSFNAPNINKFSFVLTDGYDDNDPWVLDFPNLKTLDLLIDRIPHIIDVSSVQVFHLKDIMYEMEEEDDEDDPGMFNIFFRKFLGVKIFQLSCKASEPFLHRLDLIDDLHLLETTWKSLALELVLLCDNCLLGIYRLMRSLKHLEELIIYTTEETTVSSVCSTSSLCIHEDSEASLYTPPFELPSDYVMPKLKTVTLHGLVKPWNRQLQLVEFLLKTAIILDKLVIAPSKRVLTEGEELEFVKHVSSFKRASTSARVFFA
ncbi:F-box/FBD/LRR-repeat protein At4g26340-like isoform X1 [Silene latifolia]|uniref:F-box/FBD/LRR-repeat protein At4g26340-like isoform X1 n=1 Tax=Silene latifolia TaxID=37657 RepID=UPI003D78AC5C